MSERENLSIEFIHQATGKTIGKIDIGLIALLSGKQPEEIAYAVARQVSGLIGGDDIGYHDPESDDPDDGFVINNRPGRGLVVEYPGDLYDPKLRQKVSQWVRKHPNACPFCHGAGELSYQDDPSAGVGSLGPGSMEFSDPCWYCVDRNENPVCPLCCKPLDADHMAMCDCDENDMHPLLPVLSE